MGKRGWRLEICRNNLESLPSASFIVPSAASRNRCASACSWCCRAENCMSSFAYAAAPRLANGPLPVPLSPPLCRAHGVAAPLRDGCCAGEPPSSVRSAMCIETAASFIIFASSVGAAWRKLAIDEKRAATPRMPLLRSLLGLSITTSYRHGAPNGAFPRRCLERASRE